MHHRILLFKSTKNCLTKFVQCFPIRCASQLRAFNKITIISKSMMSCYTATIQHPHNKLSNPLQQKSQTSVGVSPSLGLGKCASHGTVNRSSARRWVPSDISQQVSLKAYSQPSDSSTSSAGCSMDGSWGGAPAGTCGWVESDGSGGFGVVLRDR